MIPLKVKIGAHLWEVIHTNYIDDCGQSDENQCRILINPKDCSQAQESTFIHELLHAACSFAGIANDEKLTEEQFVTRTEKALHMILRDNGFWPFETRKFPNPSHDNGT